MQIYAKDVQQKTFTKVDAETNSELNKIFKSVPTISSVERANIVQSMEINTEPILPKPYEKVTATIENFSTDLDRADISWYIGNTLKESGMGKTKFNFETKGLGESIVIRATIRTMEGYFIVKKYVATPEDLDIAWEAKTYTPPFYKGKAMLTPNSIVKIIAMPNFIIKGQRISPNKLIYIWRKDGKVVKEKSGYGKSVFYDESPYLYEKRKISVEVTTYNNSVTSYKKIYIISDIPEVLFYKDDPIEGVLYRKAIADKLNLDGQELSLTAEPYFFSSKDKDVGNLVYKWFLNNKQINNTGQSATFRQENKKTIGFSRIKINIKNIYRKYQEAENSFILNFN